MKRPTDGRRPTNTPPTRPNPALADGPLGLMPPWLVSVLRPIALTVMVACIALPLTQVVTSVVPGLHGELLLGAMLVAAIEAHYTYHLIRSRYISGAEIWRIHLIEFGVYFVLIKLAQVALIGEPAGGWPSDPRDILMFLFDIEAILAIGLAIAVSLLVNDTLEDLDRVGEPPEHDKQYVTPLDSLTDRFFVGGGLVLVLSGLARVGLIEVLNLERPPVTGLVANVLTYFVVGFLLLGQVRLGTLAAGWQAQGARVPPELGGRWVRYSLIALAIAGLIAFALPTGYSAGALDWLGTALAIVLSVLWATVAILAAICLLPVGWLMSLLSRGGAPDQPVQPLQVTPPPELFTQTLPPWIDLLKTIIVWGLVAAMVLYVVSNYLRERPGLLRALRDLGALRGLRQMWAALRHRLSGLAAAVDAAPLMTWLRARLQARTAAGPLRYFRLGGATPREQVQYYYLSLLRRAGERGFGRRPNQTPSEYHPTLRANLPEQTADVEALTAAFIETRYSAHPIEAEQVGRVRAAWNRLRAALNRIQKNTPKG